MCCWNVLARVVDKLEEQPIFAKFSGEDLYQVLQNAALPRTFNAKAAIQLVLNWMGLQAPGSCQKEEMRRIFSVIDVPALPEKDIWELLLGKPTLVQNTDLL